MVEILLSIRDYLFYFSELLILLTLVGSWRGMTSMELFEWKYIKRLRFIVFVVLFAFILNFVLQTRIGRPFGLDFWLLLIVVGFVSFALLRLKIGMIHGKKFKIVCYSYLIAFIAMTALLIYLEVFGYADIIL